MRRSRSVRLQLVPAAVALVLVAVLGSARALAGSSTASPTGWCGSQTAVDQPDSSSAFLIHVVYAIPSDGADRASERTMPILSDLAAIQNWWQTQDPSRDLRLDLLDAPCDSTIGRLDLSVVRLPRDAAYYGGARDGFQHLTSDLEQQLGFRSPEKKYLVYYDGPEEVHRICGASPLGPPRTNATSVVYLDSYCAGDLGLAGEAAATAAHELLHNLAARPRLHPCAGTPAHVCDSTRDILYYTVEEGVSLTILRLDVGQDDYYNLPASTRWWDIRNSPFLERVGSPGPAASLALRYLTAVSRDNQIILGWGPAAGRSGYLYRVHRDGELLSETATLTAKDTGPPGSTLVYSVRVTDKNGYLGAPLTIRVLVGTGVVGEGEDMQHAGCRVWAGTTGCSAVQISEASRKVS